MNINMNAKTMVFTVQMPENGKPIIYAQLASDKHKLFPELSEDLIHSWFDRNDLASASEDEIKDLAYNMRHDGYAWWNETYCFELSEVCG